MRTILLAILLAARAFAATEAELIEQLKVRAPDKFLAVRENEDPASPIVALYGDLADLSGASATAFDDWIKTYGTLLGYPAGAGMPADYKSFVVKHAAGGSVLRYQHKHDWKYFGGTVGFHLDPAGKLVAVTGRHKSVTIGVTSLTDVVALGKALAKLADEGDVRISGDGVINRFVAEMDDGSHQPIFQLKVAVGDPMEERRITVGPTGEILCSSKSGERFDAAGKILDGYPEIAHQQDRPVPRLLDSMQGDRRWHLESAEFVNKSSAYLPTLSSRKRFDFPTDFSPTIRGEKVKLSHPRYLATSVYHHLMKAHDAALAMGIPEVDELWTPDDPTSKPQLPFDPWSRPNWNDPDDDNTENAFYLGSEKGLIFQWWQKNHDWHHPAADPSVIYHEYGHYVLHRLNPDWSSMYTRHDLGDAKSISEGFADWFSIQVSGAESFGKYWLGARERKPSLTPDYCAMLPLYDSFDRECQPDDGKTEIHKAGQLFSGLGQRLLAGALADDRKEALTRVIESVRTTVPMTFRSFALTTMAVAACHGDHAKLPGLVALWREAGLFKKCP